MGSIDLNADIGESFGGSASGSDEALLRWISSANIACGFHAGDAKTMRRTVHACLQSGVRIGAHPGLPDLQGFGRRAMALSAEEVYEITLYQIGALQAIAAAEGGSVAHVKPHGALYHMAEADEGIASAIARATEKASPGAALVGISGGRLIAAGKEAGLRILEEAFADRAYDRLGKLLPRTSPGAVLDIEESARQAVRLARDGMARTSDGETIRVRADTICLHGDEPLAAERAEAVNRALTQAGFRIAPKETS